MALVIDLSNNNGNISLTSLKAAGVRGVIAKATEGVTFNDAMFNSLRTRASALGLYFGAYHFAQPGHNAAVDEARHFCQVVKTVDSKDIKPSLDFETPSKLTPEQQEEWIRAFNAEVKKRLGLYPMFYSYPAFIKGIALEKTVGNGLWLADYGPDDGKPHTAAPPAPWKKIALHQYTSKGVLHGVPGEFDLSNGSLWSILAHPVRALLT